MNDTTVEAGRGRQGRRRPSGEPPPLPREDRWARWIWVLAAVLLLGAGLNALITWPTWSSGWTESQQD